MSARTRSPSNPRFARSTIRPSPRRIVVEPYAARFPFSYSAEDALDLGQTKERHYFDPEHRIEQWAENVLDGARGGTFETLVAMTSAIKEQFQYLAREREGVQSPLETLELRSGSCRDFAVFMMEAARSLGLGARFVSGYLYDERSGRRSRRHGGHGRNPRMAAGFSARRRVGGI